MLREALEVIEAWGFTYKTVAFNWVKQNKTGAGLFWGLGNWTRSNSEICLLAVKGKPKRMSASVHSVILSPVQQHSRKPAETRDRIVELTKALCKVKRATPGATTTAAIANVIEEIADVQIMLDQLRLIFARSTEEVEEDKLRRLLGRLNSYAESNLHDWLNKQPEPGIWCRTVGSGAQPREGGAPDE